MGKIGIVFGSLVFILLFFLAWRTLPEKEFVEDKQRNKSKTDSSVEPDVSGLKEKDISPFNAKVFVGEVASNNIVSENVELEDEKSIENASTASEKCFSNVAEYEEDLLLLVRERRTDSKEVKKLKKKLNQRISCDFQKIGILDLLEHIKVSLDMENDIILPKELEEKIREKNLIVNFSYRLAEKPAGIILGFLLDGEPKLSYDFQGDKLYLFEASIGTK